MKPILTILVMLLASACSGPEVPKAFLADSPASPDTPPVSRMSVASVLTAPDPLDARACAPDKACALGETPTAMPASGGHQHGGHQHGNHSGHDSMNHGGHNHAGHNHANHSGKPPAPATNQAGHDHSGHRPTAPPSVPPAAPPAAHEHHSGHNH